MASRKQTRLPGRGRLAPPPRGATVTLPNLPIERPFPCFADPNAVGLIGRSPACLFFKAPPRRCDLALVFPCRRGDKRITGEISSTGLNKGRLETLSLSSARRFDVSLYPELCRPDRSLGIFSAQRRPLAACRRRWKLTSDWIHV